MRMPATVVCRYVHEYRIVAVELMVAIGVREIVAVVDVSASDFVLVE